MLATPERIRGYGHDPDLIVWHKPAGPAVADFQPIACSADEGITLPWPRREVPLQLDVPNESWCPDCLAIIRSK
jgi:hypothetical protein